jgi:hypothetical protein
VSELLLSFLFRPSALFQREVCEFGGEVDAAWGVPKEFSSAVVQALFKDPIPSRLFVSPIRHGC